jgi:hypothetical protein
MVANFFDKEPATWQELEEMVHQAFTEMGYVSNRAHKLGTVRGTVEIDVHAINLTESESRGPPPLRINYAVRFSHQQGAVG